MSPQGGISENISGWLAETDEHRLDLLWTTARQVREQFTGRQVHLRGLIEISNLCERNCTYCGLRAGNKNLPRYRMTDLEILECAKKASDLGYGTVVLQSGEHPSIETRWLCGIVRAIKRSFPLAVTLSVGERPLCDYANLRECGADRYLLKFETSNARLFSQMQSPLSDGLDRLARLRFLRRIGYEIGSGTMVGLPGQGIRDYLRDLFLFCETDPDMIAVGPYIAHPGTPLGKKAIKSQAPQPDSALMTRKVMALARLLCPTANIPATTALATSERGGYQMGLDSGANVIMPNITPLVYRAQYEIYPDSAALEHEDMHREVLRVIEAAGMEVGKNRGDRRRQRTEFAAPTWKSL